MQLLKVFALVIVLLTSACCQVPTFACIWGCAKGVQLVPLHAVQLQCPHVIQQLTVHRHATKHKHLRQHMHTQLPIKTWRCVQRMLITYLLMLLPSCKV